MKKTEKEVLLAKAKVLKALAHPARLWIVEQLEVGERCVCELVARLVPTLKHSYMCVVFYTTSA